MATQDEKDKTTTALEQQAVALAEQLGRIAGTIEGTAEQWLNRPNIAEQLTRVRDSATQMLETLAGGAARGRQAAVAGAGAVAVQVSKLKAAATGGRATGRASEKKPARAAKASIDRAHAPGKKHMKPGPTMRGAKKSNLTIPKMRTAQAARQRRKSYA